MRAGFLGVQHCIQSVNREEPELRGGITVTSHPFLTGGGNFKDSRCFLGTSQATCFLRTGWFRAAV